MVDHFQPVEQFIHRIIEEGRVPGAGIAVALDGQPIFTRVAGEGNHGILATDDTLWPLAAVSMLSTASAIMSLLEDGRMEP